MGIEDGRGEETQAFSEYREGSGDNEDSTAGLPTAAQDFENPPPVTAWRQPGQTRLDALLDFVPRSERPPDVTPWEPGHEIRIQSLGGIVSKERRRYTIVGHDEYHHRVAGHRNGIIHTSQKLTHSQNHTVMVGAQDVLDQIGTADLGKDFLEVRGDARIEFHSRTTMMSGIISRRLENGVVRLASMEGVICGGLFARTIVGPSANMSPLCSGDVYGGVARAAVNRSMLAILLYRAAASAAWACGVYVRSANVVVEPLLSSPASTGPRGLILAKLARLSAAANKVATPLRAVVMPLDLLLGVVTFIPMLLMGLGMLAYNIIKSPIAIPPAGPPRVHNRNVGLDTSCFTSMLYT